MNSRKSHANTLEDASDTESTEPESPNSEASWDDIAAEQIKSETTEATFALTDLPVPPDTLIDTLTDTQRGVGHKLGAYSCPECGKMVTRLDSLSRHRRTRHHIGKQYFCPYPKCKKARSGIGRFDLYRRHMQVSHGDTVGKLRGPGAGGRSTEKKFRDQRRESQQEALPESRVLARRTRTHGAAVSKPPPNKILSARVSVPKPRPPPPPPTRDLSDGMGTHALPQRSTTKTATATAELPILGTLRPFNENFESMSQDELVLRLRAKTRECEELQQKCRILTLEKEEYVEALAISEQLRGA
ncbi:hypothetical protein BJ170DRAFT_182781 [Xylariales sp. AK1849]|nr:hypothetical protein BJ170DRAFT_182781 [Xylariales sp. AK1849]